MVSIQFELLIYQETLSNSGRYQRAHHQTESDIRSSVVQSDNLSTSQENMPYSRRTAINTGFKRGLFVTLYRHSIDVITYSCGRGNRRELSVEGR